MMTQKVLSEVTAWKFMKNSTASSFNVSRRPYLAIAIELHVRTKHSRVWSVHIDLPRTCLESSPDQSINS